MSKYKTTIWRSDLPKQFVEALLAIEDGQTIQNFLSDVMTEKEIIEISSRLEAAKMLKSGRTYNDIVAKTKLSSRTVARISDWMKNGSGGYAKVLSGINHQSHITPVRAE